MQNVDIFRQKEVKIIHLKIILQLHDNELISICISIFSVKFVILQIDLILYLFIYLFNEDCRQLMATSDFPQIMPIRST